jgi:hypothetical protein
MSDKDKKIITNDLFNDPIKYKVYQTGLIMLEELIEQLEYTIQYNNSCLEQVKAHYKKFTEAFEEIEENGKSEETFNINRQRIEIMKELHDFLAQELPPEAVWNRLKSMKLIKTPITGN